MIHFVIDLCLGGSYNKKTEIHFFIFLFLSFYVKYICFKYFKYLNFSHPTLSNPIEFEGNSSLYFLFQSRCSLTNCFIFFTLDDNSVVGAERINDNKKVKLLDKRPIFLKFITPEQQLKSDSFSFYFFIFIYLLL